MTAVRKLTFNGTAGSLIASILVVLVTIVVAYVAWRRSGYQRSIGLQELLRVAIVILVAILFNQPEYVEEFRPEERPTIAVLWDKSPSMETRDVVAGPSESIAPVTRAEAIRP